MRKKKLATLLYPIMACAPTQTGELHYAAYKGDCKHIRELIEKKKNQ